MPPPLKPHRPHALVFAYDCKPFNDARRGVGGLRPYLFAKHLPEAGWDCTVICAAAEQVGSSIEGPGWRIIGVVPGELARGRRIWEYLVRRNSGGVIRKLLSWYFSRRGDNGVAWAGPAVARALHLHRDNAFDAVIGEHPSDGGVEAASRFARVAGVLLFVDLREPIGASFDHDRRRLSYLVSRTRDARAITTTTAGWLHAFEEAYQLPTFVVPHTYDAIELADAVPLTFSAPTIVYAGSTHEGQPWNSVARSFAAVPSIRLWTTGYGAHRIRDAFASHGCADRLDVFEQLPEDAALRAEKGASALLFLAHPGGNVSGRTFEQIATGRPIIYFPADGSELAMRIRFSGARFKAVENEPELVRVLGTIGDGTASWDHCSFLQGVAAHAPARRAERLVQVLNAFSYGEPYPPKIDFVTRSWTGRPARRRRLLIFGHQCWPFNAPGSVMAGQRAYQFARHLPGCGWDVTVLCASNTEGEHSPSPHARVVAVLNPAATGLRRAWSDLSRQERPRAFGVLARRVLTGILAATGDQSMEWVAPAVSVAREQHDRQPFDAVLGTHSPDGSLAAAAAFAATTGVPGIADLRDEPDDREHPLIAPYRRRFRQWMSHMSAGLAPNPKFADRFARRYDVPFSTVYNGYDPVDFDGTPAFSWECPTIFVGGSLYLEHQDWGGIFSAVRDVRQRQTFHFAYAGYAGPGFSELAERADVADMCPALGLRPRPEAIARMKGATALLLAGWTAGPHVDAGIVPGKAFEYIGAGRPILVYPTAGNEALAELIVDGGFGWAVSSPEELAERIEAVLGGKMPDRWQARQPLLWSRRASAEQLAGLLDRIGRGAEHTIPAASAVAVRDAELRNSR